MKTKTSKKSIVFRNLLLLPLLALLLYGFSDKIVVPLYEEPTTEETFVDFQKGATTKQITEYNALAKKYNRQLSESKHIQIYRSDVERLDYLYGLMTLEQKENAEPFPDFPEPPPAPKVPDAPNPVQKIINEQDIYDELDRPVSLSAIKPNKTFEAISAPKPPIVKKGELSNIPPPPPSAPKGIQGERSTIAPNAPEVHVGEVSDIPPPPPPKSPIDHVVEMSKKDATFYFEGIEISSDKAIAILKKNKKINIRTKHEGFKKPIVELSTKSIIIKK